MIQNDEGINKQIYNGWIQVLDKKIIGIVSYPNIKQEGEVTFEMKLNPNKFDGL